MENISTLQGLPALGLPKRSDAEPGSREHGGILHTSNYFMVCTHFGGCLKAVLLIHRFVLVFSPLSCQLAELAATGHLGRATVGTKPPFAQDPLFQNSTSESAPEVTTGTRRGGALEGACSLMTKPMLRLL